jgi:hypothetical protein
MKQWFLAAWFQSSLTQAGIMLAEAIRPPPVFLQLQKKHKIPKKNLNVENEAYQ